MVLKGLHLVSSIAQSSSTQVEQEELQGCQQQAAHPARQIHMLWTIKLSQETGLIMNSSTHMLNSGQQKRKT